MLQRPSTWVKTDRFLPFSIATSILTQENQLPQPLKLLLALLETALNCSYDMQDNIQRKFLDFLAIPEGLEPSTC